MSTTVDQLHTVPVPSEHVRKCSIKIKGRKELSRQPKETVGEQMISICWVGAVFDISLWCFSSRPQCCSRTAQPQMRFKPRSLVEDG